MGAAIFRAFACAVAGLVAWALVEPFFPANVFDPDWSRIENIFIAVNAALIGLAAGLHVGYMRGSRRHLIQGGIIGLIFGTLGGMFGYQIGGTIVASMFESDVFTGAATLPTQMLARTLAFVPFGALLGAAIGAARLSSRAVLAGLVGGIIAAALGGMFFDLIGIATGPLTLAFSSGNEVGAVPRATMVALLGLGIGLFTALVDAATRRAWVRLVLGRNEGREWPLDSAQTMIGRDERAHVPLFGDPNVAPLHATIVRQGGDYWLTDQGSPLGTGLNGSHVQSERLKSGDSFQIGSHTLLFLTKGSRLPQPTRQDPAPVQQVAQTPTPSAPNALWSLVAVSGPASGSRFPIHSPTEIGRESQGISLTGDTMASRRHARITPSPTALQIEDLGSTNGTLVNGVKTSYAMLNHGDTVQIGGTQLRVERA